METNQRSKQGLYFELWLQKLNFKIKEEKYMLFRGKKAVLWNTSYGASISTQFGYSRWQNKWTNGDSYILNNYM
jgi:hypothetical protein